MTASFKGLNSLMRHMRASGVAIEGSADKRMLARVGYFHGYKGYRFSGSPSRRMPYISFGEVTAVIDFDTRLKGLFYPLLMKLEMSMKNLALVEILDGVGSSALVDVYASMPGTKKGRMKGKLGVIHFSNGVLLDFYIDGNRIARHYYDSTSGSVPVWALMEVMTLGHFARFLEQLADADLKSVAQSWGLQTKYGDLAPHLVFAMKDLRNCVAHNGMVFDTRFKTAKVRQEISRLLRDEIGYARTVQVRFDTISDYVILVVYLARMMGFPKREIRVLIREYETATEDLFNKVSFGVFSMIVHPDNRAKVNELKQWV